MPKDLTVIIPVYNEAKTITEVINKVLIQPRVGQVIVIDDKSKDNTLELVQNFGNKVELITKERNYGKGHSIRLGIAAAKCHYTIVQDADLELDPESYTALFAKLERSNADMVNSVRDMDNKSNVKFISKLASMMIPVTVFILFGKRIKDVVSCYKLMTTENYRKLNLTSDRFEIETEIIVKAIKAGYIIVEEEVPFHPRSVAEGKHIRWWDGIKVLRLLMKYRLGLLK